MENVEKCLSRAPSQDLLEMDFFHGHYVETILIQQCFSLVFAIFDTAHIN